MASRQFTGIGGWLTKSPVVGSAIRRYVLVETLRGEELRISFDLRGIGLFERLQAVKLLIARHGVATAKGRLIGVARVRFKLSLA